jgi:ankyrin repeat protein
VLQFAARRGDITAMRRLIDDGADPNELVPTSNSKGQFTGLQTSALISALNAKEEAAVRLLLERGADPSLADSMFITPLIAATICHNLAMVRLLLGSGSWSGSDDGSGWGSSAGDAEIASSMTAVRDALLGAAGAGAGSVQKSTFARMSRGRFRSSLGGESGQQQQGPALALADLI